MFNITLYNNYFYFIMFLFLYIFLNNKLYFKLNIMK